MNTISELKTILETYGYPKPILKSMGLILETTGKIADKLRAQAARFDREGAKMENGVVSLPEGNMEFFKTLAESGILGLIGKRAYGGAEMPVPLFAACMEILASACPSTTVAACIHEAEIDLLQEHASEEVKQKYLPPLISGKKLGGLAFTEANAGSDIGAAKTQAILDPSGKYYVLNGVKQFITSGGIADIFVVLATTRPDRGMRGLCTFVVDRTETEGFKVSRIENKLGIKANPTGELVFTDCRIPRENLVGAEGDGFRLALSGLDGGRVGVGAQAVGISESAYAEAVKYASERCQFGSPINRLPPIKEKLARMSTLIHAGRLSYMVGAHLKGSGQEYAIEAAIAKVFASEAAEWVTRENIQVHGGYGYMHEYNAERHYRDARITTIYEGTSEIQRVVVSRDLLHPRGSQLMNRIRKNIDALTGSGKFPELLEAVKAGAGRLENSIRRIQQLGDKFAKQLLATPVVDLSASVYLSTLMLDHLVRHKARELETRLFIDDMSRETARLEAEIGGEKHLIIAQF